jgi:hypothetical protein
MVTIHGIGFQQPPNDTAGVAGYADVLHANLKQSLHDALGEDPGREHGGAVYVQSEYPALSKDTEKGLDRIGTWDADRQVVQGTPLTRPGASIAHVALVYSGDEEYIADPAAGVIMALLCVGGAPRYASLEGLMETFGNDLRGIFHRKSATNTSSQAAAAAVAGSHPVTALVDHVGGYVARNVLRERVRFFVREAITRLAARPDVARIVLNTHSNGTVIAFDVLERVPAALARKLSLFVTAGSPLRKYVNLLSWGHEVDHWPGMTWLNYYDIDDPVADQLRPPVEVRITGDPDMGGPGLFVTYAPDSQPLAVEDKRVNNVAAGRDPHDYWGNREFCELLAGRIKAL